jgi:hypothetical protein
VVVNGDARRLGSIVAVGAKFDQAVEAPWFQDSAIM